jgi:UDP-glucose:glycoprotein glucosyltransferase
MLALQAHSAPSVNVGMNAAFPAGPYLLELLYLSFQSPSAVRQILNSTGRETAAAENSSAYFPLLDRIATGYFDSAATDAALYEKFLGVLQEDGCLSSAESLSTFKLALSLRSAAPRIEAHYQYYNTAVVPNLSELPESECFNWVLLDGKQYCRHELETVIKDGLGSLYVCLDLCAS